MSEQSQKGLSKLPPMHKLGKTTSLIHLPKNGKSNATYAKENNITKRQASKQRRNEKHA